MNRAVLLVFLREFTRGTGLFGAGRLFGIRRHGFGGDFISLFGLGAIIITIIAFSISAGRGITENLSNAMLGNIRGAGAPIWVFGHPANGFVIDPAYVGISPDETTIAATTDAGKINFYPVTEIEPKDSHMRVPGDMSWSNLSSSGDANVDMRGWALSRKNPVWLQYAGISASINTIILSKALFRAHFHYDQYRQALAPALPAPALRNVPETLRDLGELDHIYLSLPFQESRRRLVRFDIVWAESLPALQKISFIVTDDMLSLAAAVRSNAGLAMAFDTDRNQFDEPHSILTGFSFRGTTTGAVKKALAAAGGDAAFERLVKCLGPSAGMEARESRVAIRWNEVFYAGDANSCLAEAGLKDIPNLAPAYSPFPRMVVEGALLQAPCEALSNTNKAAAVPKDCVEGPVSYLPNRDIRNGLIFIPGNHDIADDLDRIKAARGLHGGPVFLIGENYLDALGRMDFTKKVIAYLSVAMAMLGAVLCFAVLYLQMRPMIARRAASYGLLVARGMSPGAIYVGFMMQLLLTLAASAIAGIVFYMLMRLGIEYWFQSSDAAQAARAGIGLLEVRLVPMRDDAWNILGVGLSELAASIAVSFAITACIALVCAFLVMHRLPLRLHSLPISLIAGRSSAQAAAPARKAVANARRA